MFGINSSSVLNYTFFLKYSPLKSRGEGGAGNRGGGTVKTASHRDLEIINETLNKVSISQMSVDAV